MPTPIKIWLDDVRPAPSEEWTHCHWPNEVIELLKLGDVEVVSLDHDLGDDERGTGYDVVLWIEEEAFENKFFRVPEIRVHSANSPASDKMRLGIRSIHRRVASRD